jgi:hypothetical protein
METKDYNGIVLALGGLAVSAMVFFLTQLRNTSLERSMLEAQRAAAVARKTSMQEGITAADEALKAREKKLQRAQKLESEYALLLTDLLELANIDPDARAITSKWKIQQQARQEQSAGLEPPNQTNERKEKGAAQKGVIKSQKNKMPN